MNEERKRLIEEINKAMFRDEDKGCVKPSEIADFIIADRKRICEPLIEVNKFLRTEDIDLPMFGYHYAEAIDKTLNRAGFGDGK